MSTSRSERVYREYILDIYLFSKTSKRPQSYRFKINIDEKIIKYKTR